MVLKVTEMYSQDAGLIISWIDPDKVGLLSFPAFCRAVATIMTSDYHGKMCEVARFMNPL